MIPKSFDRTRLHTAYAQGLAPESVIAEVFARLDDAGDPGIFISLFAQEQVFAAARGLPPFDPVRYPVWGLPFAVKDNIDLAGLPTTAACPAFAYDPQASAFAVERLLAAGALAIGKTNLDQFATGLVGARTPYPVPRNTFDPRRVPGGSSSGSAVAVARGIVSFALGTDTAGSGRVPAALNNIVGLKPSLGAVSTRGVVPACRTLDCVSVFATTVDDAFAVYAAMAALDPVDAYSRAIVPGAPGALPPAVTIGVPRERDLAFADDPEQERVWRVSMDQLASLGARLVTVDLTPFFAAAKLLYEGPWIAERHAAIRAFMSAHEDAVLPVTRGIIGSAKVFSATDLFEAQYTLAELRRQTRPLWDGIDALAVPSAPNFPTLEELKADPLGPNARLGTYTNFVNLLDLAALAVPAAMRGDGLPAGVTLIGPSGSDARLAALGRVLHVRSGLAMGASGEALPSLATCPDAPGDMIEIVVVGAHLSGLPLNRELIAAGATFKRAAATAPCYRLHALTGRDPERPGMLRVAEGEGVAIQTEVWALPAGAFGRFAAAIPPPLGLGTIRLHDGTLPKGFLVEPQGLAGAVDISAFGGWRAYLRSKASASE